MRNYKRGMKKLFIQMFVTLFVFGLVLASEMSLKAQTVAPSQPESHKNVVTEEVEAEKATIVYSGTENNLKWSIDSNGHLYITGSGDYDIYPHLVGWFFHNEEIKTATVDVVGMTSTYELFIGMDNLTNVDLSNFDTSKVTNMKNMFLDCSGLTSLDLSNFDTSKVTTMENMFSGCSSLTSLDVSKFNTSQVTDMSSMFNGCSSLTSIDVSNFDTSQVTDMSWMFNGCSSLTSIDVSNFDTSQVTDMSQMFQVCSGLTSLDLSNFDTSQVTEMDNMFISCSSLTSIIAPQNMSSELPYVVGYEWCYKPNNTCVTEITKAGTYIRVKEGTTPAEEGTTPTEEGTTPTIKTGTQFTKSNIQYEVVTHTSSKHTVKAYKGTKKTATSISIPKTVTYEGITFDVVSISKNAFKEYKKATKLTIGSKVTSIGESAFQNCTKLKTLTIGNEVTSIGKKAFYGCKALTSVSIPSKVKTIGDSAFSNCTKLKTVIIGSAVKTIGASAFKGDSKLITINIYSKKLSKVGKSAFSGIDKYAKIYVPDSKLSAYKKLLKNKGQKSSVKIVKQATNKYTGKSVIAIGNCEISYEKEFTYTGKAIKPKVTVTYNNSTLIKGTNYTVSYKNNIEAGTATIVIKGKGIYVGTVEKNFTITVPYKYPTIEHDVVFVDQQEGTNNKTSYCGIASAAVVEWWRYKNGKGATYMSDWDRYDYIENKESKLPLSTLLCKNMRKRNNKNNPTNANTNWGTIFGEGVIVKGSYSKNKNVYYKSSKFNNEELEKMYERLKNGPLIVHRDAGHYSVVYAYVGNEEKLEASGFMVQEVHGGYSYNDKKERVNLKKWTEYYSTKACYYYLK